jgi:hypothetical protein
MPDRRAANLHSKAGRRKTTAKRSQGFTRDVTGAYADSDSPHASLTCQVKRDEGGEIH